MELSKPPTASYTAARDIVALLLLCVVAPSNAVAAVQVVTLAGQGNSLATWDAASGANARFSSSAGLAVDTGGNLFIADYVNSVIRKMTPGGQVTTFAGLAGSTGSTDGFGGAARFNGPQSVAVDGSGNVYVLDCGNNIVRKITPAGKVTTFAGLAGATGDTDGTGSAARFITPNRACVDSSGNIYLTDSGNNNIRMITPAGVVTTIAGSNANPGVAGSTDATGTAARFSSPLGIAIDSTNTNLYVVDHLNSTLRQIVISTKVVTTLAGLAGAGGTTDGTGNAARFNLPADVCLDGSGNLIVSDYHSYTMRKVTTAGAVTTVAGTAGTSGIADGTGAAARFNFQNGCAADASGNIYIADQGNNEIRKMTTPGYVVTTLGGWNGQGGSTDGAGAAASFSSPCGVAVDSSGNVYVTDFGNNVIRKITPAGVVTTLAGLAGSSGSTDATGSAARFNGPRGITIDSSNNLYVAEYLNHTIRKITSGGVVTTLAGLALTSGISDGTGNAARFNNPLQVSVDSGSNNLYVADRTNDTIRKVTIPGGVVTTPYGSAGLSGSTNANGTSARFSFPCGVTVAASGNLYVGDYGNFTVRKIDTSGNVTTIAGIVGSQGTANNATGTSAQFGRPIQLAVDSSEHNLYVADNINNEIRQISLTAPYAVSVFVGSTSQAAGSQDGLGTAASLTGSQGVCIDSSGNFYVADTGNNVIRKMSTQIADVATVDTAAAPIPQIRTLNTNPSTATAWSWKIIRIPTGSACSLSATNIHTRHSRRTLPTSSRFNSSPPTAAGTRAFPP